VLSLRLLDPLGLQSERVGCARLPTTSEIRTLVSSAPIVITGAPANTIHPPISIVPATPTAGGPSIRQTTTISRAIGPQTTCTQVDSMAGRPQLKIRSAIATSAASARTIRTRSTSSNVVQALIFWSKPIRSSRLGADGIVSSAHLHIASSIRPNAGEVDVTH
jgi:hypothetical protein